MLQFNIDCPILLSSTTDNGPDRIWNLNKQNMTTYTVTGEDKDSELEAAIKRSISHNEIVRVECEDTAQLADYIESEYDEADHATENNGDKDVWGKCAGDDFRLRLATI